MDVLSRIADQTGLAHLSWQQPVMWLLAVLLIYLAIRKKYEPYLLLPIGFGIILVNLPLTGLVGSHGLLRLFYYGIEYEVLPPLIFIGLGAMTDFGPILANPKTLLLGAAAQLGVFAAFMGAIVFGFNLAEAAAIGIIGGADGPTTIFLTQAKAPDLLGATAISAYSYMALVPLILPPIMKLLTSKEERAIVMKPMRKVKKTEKIIFPVLTLLVVCLLVPQAAPLIGMFMLGNLFRESGVVKRLFEAAQAELSNLVTIFLGLGIAFKLQGPQFLQPKVLLIFALGLVSFCLSAAGGILLAKLMNLLSRNKINPLIGAAGLSAVPMAARVVQVEGQKANPKNYLLMYAMGPNVAGVIGTVVAAGIFMALV